MRCPVCRADNNQEPTCRRCKADLALLWAIEDQRRECLEAARASLRQGKREAALNDLRRAEELRRGPDVARLVALVHLLGGNFAEALRYHQQASEPES